SGGIHVITDGLVPAQSTQSKTPLLRIFITRYDESFLGIGNDGIKSKRKDQRCGDTHNLQIGRPHDDLLIGYDFLLIAPNSKMGMGRVAGGKYCMLVVYSLC